jgi:hypothetical protein
VLFHRQMRQGGSEIAWQGFSQPVLALPRST